MDAIKLAAAAPTIDTLADLVRLLRSKQGCPWDQQQTPDTVKRYLIEEAYELMEAMEDGVPAQICEELGDLLFQIVFVVCLYEERGAFSMRDVIRQVMEKMIRRHPHVFADKNARNTEEVKVRWHKIKRLEKGTREPKSILDSIPRNLPALMRAHRITERAARAGFALPDIGDSITKIDSILSNVKERAEKDEREEIAEEFGELLLTIVALGRLLEVHAETALDQSLQHFIKKFKSIEPFLSKDKLDAPG